MEEERKVIPGYELYSVSNLGYIYNTKSGRRIKTGIRKNGERVRFYFYGGMWRSIALLVITNFVPNPMNYVTFHHKDRNKLNNCASNLEWVSKGAINRMYN